MLKGDLFIILEGPDGSGKTTLANEFNRRGFTIEHCGPPEEHAYDYWLRRVRACSGFTVFDRLHVGSYVYGNAFRGADDMSAFERWMFEGTLIAAGAAMIYTRPPDHVMDQNLSVGDRGPDAVYESRASYVRRLYEEFFDSANDGANPLTDIPVYQYDFTRDDMSRFVTQTLLQVLRAPWVQDLPFVKSNVLALGNVRSPRYVFVGDEPHPKRKLEQCMRRTINDQLRNTRDDIDPGFVDQRISRVLATAARVSRSAGVFDSRSGMYLFNALRNSGLRLTDYCVFNSAQLSGLEVKDFLVRRDISSDIDWVALGNNASRRLTEANIAHRTVPHPQHVRRFFYKQGLLDYPNVLLGKLDPGVFTRRFA